MAYGYWKSGTAEREAVFHLFFRSNPFGGGFGIACGLGPAMEFLEDLHYSDDDVAYLAGLRDPGGGRLFEVGFLDHLRALRFTCDVDAVPEGTALFPQEPLVRVRGPLLQGQLLETPLLCLLNFQTLIATKAARVCLAAAPDPVLEFGLRRAQGLDGGLAASRAAYVGGADATSNVLAGKLYGIPVRGTHAHSWVLAFGSEREAFERYAEALPDNCIFLVDTYESLGGIRHAIEAGEKLRARGHELLGVRLDSGDLGLLSREARRMLDAAGFPRAAVVATSDLDEHRIAALKEQGAEVGVWGVGTRLATGYDQPALTGVYKLSAIREPGQAWNRRLKISEDAGKESLPGVLQVRRFVEHGRFKCDVVYDEERGLDARAVFVPLDGASHAHEPTPREAESHDLLVPVSRAGARVYEPPALSASRDRTRAQLSSLPVGVTRLEKPESYPVGVEGGLAELRERLRAQALSVRP